MTAAYHDAMPVDWIDPGETATVEVDGMAVAIANVDGDFHAFANLCPHQGTVLGGRPLTQGHLMVCPEHGSVYDVRSGACLLPPSDGFSSDLPVFVTRVVDGVVQVAIDA